MLSFTFCSLPFWICYFWCGISDIFDGLIARKLRQQSGIGAKLDSIADFIFSVTILVTVGKNIALPMYLWWCIVAIALLRLISYSIGFLSIAHFHRFIL
ncbi:CDP-alcohol phosphatidyltransferase family protein [Clostridioides difficile]|nr:CDP-alcohol phosphatidyltransferase family protein [Clostridioides difficile]MCI4855574.1 CDP-alcohol phosphatidyltransferase family protein [Clostridioides difficile]